MTKTLADKLDGLVENNKKETENKAKSYIENMEIKTEKLCDCFLDEEFKPEEMREKLCDYLNEGHNRLFYSVISNKIFTMSDDKIAVFQGNIDKLLEYILENKNQTDKECGPMQDEVKVVIKLRDHVNLARRQVASLKTSYEDDKNRFEPLKAEIIKDMSAQLITLVGIFTALAFLVFGEISSLGMIFTNVKDVSILRLIVIGTAWALFLMNTIFVFMYCLQKITTLDMRANKNPDATLIQQYPIIYWSNLILIGLLLIFGWANIATQRCLLESINWSLITGIVLIGFFLFIIGRVLHEKTK